MRPRGLVQGQWAVYGCEWWDLMQGQRPVYGCEWWDLVQGQWAVYGCKWWSPSTYLIASTSVIWLHGPPFGTLTLKL